MKNKVEIQKGAIDPNPKTMKTMSQKEKISERQEQLSKTKWGQDMELKEPKQ